MVSFASLSLITLNACSLRSQARRLALGDFLANNKKPDIVLLQETNLLNSHKLRVPFYNVLRTDNNRTGTAILFQQNILFNEINFPLKFLVTTAVLVQLNNQNLLICSIYVPSDVSASDYSSDLTLLLDSLSNYDWWIVGGDFNSHHTMWSPLSSGNNNGKLLKSILLNRSGIDLLAPPMPTRYLSDNTIDFFLASTLLLNQFSNKFSLNTADSFFRPSSRHSFFTHQ